MKTVTERKTVEGSAGAGGGGAVGRDDVAHGARRGFFSDRLKKPLAVMETMCCYLVSKPQEFCLQSLGTNETSVTPA